MPKYYYPFIVANDVNIESHIVQSFESPQDVFNSLSKLSLSLAYGHLNELWSIHHNPNDDKRRHVIAEVEFDSESDSSFQESNVIGCQAKVKGQVKKITILAEYNFNREVVAQHKILSRSPDVVQLIKPEEAIELEDMIRFYRGENEPLLPKKPPARSQKIQAGSQLPVVGTQTIYGDVTRWFARDSVLKKLLSWPFLCSEIDATGKFWQYTTHLPVQSESTLRHILHINSLLEGADWAVNKIWLGVMTGLLVHDFVEYYMHPSNRYGNTWQQILLGLSRNEATLSCNFGSYLQMDYNYWLFISLLIGVPLVTAIGNLMPRVFWYKPILSQIDNATIESTELYKNLTDQSADWQSTFGFLSPFSRLRLAMDRATFAILQDGRLSCAMRERLNDQIIHIAQTHPGMFVQHHALSRLAMIAYIYEIERASRVDANLIGQLVQIRKKATELIENATHTPFPATDRDPSESKSGNQNSVPLLGNGALELFEGNGTDQSPSHLAFDTWYHPDICHYLLQMVENQAQCLQVMFDDAGYGNNTQTFRDQLQTLIVLANRLGKPAVCISKEPGAMNHFICILIKGNDLIVINPLGITSHVDVYQTLAELQKARIIDRLWLSSTKLQRREYEERLVSCGPISLDIALHILKDFTLERINQLWHRLETKEGILHEETQLNYYGMSIQGSLLPENLEALTRVTDATEYQQQVKEIRQRHHELLARLPSYRAQQTQKTLATYLAQCKDASPAQVLFNALITQHCDGANIGTMPEYEELNKALSTPEQSIKLGISVHQSFQAVGSQQINLTQFSERSPNYTLNLLRQYIYANYLLWSLGQNKKIGWNAFFWLTTLTFKLAVLYASARIVEAFVFKIMGAWQYSAHRDLCRSQGMVWSYIAEWAGYYCSHCGDWPFVYVNDRFTQQGCLNGLLSFSQAPAFVLAHIPRLSNVTTIDFSQQILSNWTLPQWENFLTYFERLSFLQSFNLSQVVYNPYFVDDGRIAALTAFISKVPTAQLILNNLGMGVASVTPLLEGLVNQTAAETLNSLVLSGNPIGDGGANLLYSLLPVFSFGSLILSNVGMSDYGVSQVVSVLPQTKSVTTLDISNNLVGPQTIQALTAVLQQNPSLQTLIISNNDLSQVDMEPFWQAVCNSSLTRLVAANTNLNDGQLLSAQPYLSRMPIRQYDLSYNPLTDYSVSPFFSSLAGSSVEGLDLGYTSITDDTYDTISTCVNQTVIHDLGLAGTNPSPDAFVQVARALPSSQVNRVDFSNNFLGDDNVAVFAKTLETPGNPLRTVILTNNEITDESGVLLAESATQGNVTTIILSDNPISSPTAQAFAKGLPQSVITTLNLSGCNIDGPSADALIAAENSPLENLDISNNPIMDAGAVKGAQQLITPIPHEDTLGDHEISLDQARAVHAARPNTNLKQVNAANTQLNATGAVALCRSWKSSRRNLQLEPNSFVNLKNVNLQNCQIFPAPALSSQSLSASQSTALGLSAGVFILLPLAIVGVIALGMVLFRVGKYTAQQFNACTPFWRKSSDASHDSVRAEQGQANGSVNYLQNVNNVKYENRL